LSSDAFNNRIFLSLSLNRHDDKQPRPPGIQPACQGIYLIASNTMSAFLEKSIPYTATGRQRKFIDPFFLISYLTERVLPTLRPNYDPFADGVCFINLLIDRKATREKYLRNLVKQGKYFTNPPVRFHFSLYTYCVSHFCASVSSLKIFDWVGL